MNISSVWLLKCSEKFYKKKFLTFSQWMRNRKWEKITGMKISINTLPFHVDEKLWAILFMNTELLKSLMKISKRRKNKKKVMIMVVALECKIFIWFFSSLFSRHKGGKWKFVTHFHVNECLLIARIYTACYKWCLHVEIPFDLLRHSPTMSLFYI